MNNDNDDNNKNNKQKYLIFLAGPTGAGKSKVKETVLEYLGIKTDSNNYNKYIGVDDFFEKNITAKKVFNTIYDRYKETTSDTDFKSIGNYQITKEEYDTYFNLISENIPNCISKKYFTGKISFSHFTTDVYFALRNHELDSKFETHIQQNLDKRVIFLETNAKSIDSLTSWYTSTPSQKSSPRPSRKSSPKPLSGSFCKQYSSKSFVGDFNDRTIVYVFIQCKLDSTINNMQTRFLNDIAAFMKNSDTKPVPRLPEMDKKTVEEKFGEIQTTLNDLIDDIKSDHSNHRVLIYNNTHCDDKNKETYDLVYDTTKDETNTIHPAQTYIPTKQTGGNKLRKTRRKRRSVKSSHRRRRHRRYLYRSRRRSRTRKS